MSKDKNSSDDASGDGDRSSTGRNTRSREIWSNVKDLVFGRVELDDFLYFFICFLSLAIVPLAGIGVGADYYSVAVNKRPVAESVYKGLNCSDLEEAAQSVCSMDTFKTRFTLFEEKVNFFYFKTHAGVSFCESDYNPPAIIANVTNLTGFFDTEGLAPDVRGLFHGNMGECSEIALIVTEVFACFTLIFTVLGAFWLTVLSDHYSNEATVHMALLVATMISSLITVVLFSVAINPQRPSIDPQFCEAQTTFEDCEEGNTRGLYCQIAVTALSFILTLVYAFKLKFNTSGRTVCCERNDDDDDQDHQSFEGDEQEQQLQGQEDLISRQQHQHQPAIHKQLHFWVKLGRFLEFFLALLALMTNFTTLELLSPDPNDTPVKMSSYLWGNEFCSHNFFFMDAIRLYNGVDDKNDELLGKNYGDCSPSDLFEIYLAFGKILFFGGLSLFLKRDAAKNPLFYLAGLISDIITIVFVCLAIKAFYTEIYPGRIEIEPSFCDQYSELRHYLGYEYQGIDDCSISLGLGFWVLCMVLVITVTNFFVEFVIGEIGQEYGAVNAFMTVFNRVREGKIKHAIMSPASIYVSSTTQKDVHIDDGGDDETGDNDDQKVNEVIIESENENVDGEHHHPLENNTPEEPKHKKLPQSPQRVDMSAGDVVEC